MEVSAGGRYKAVLAMLVISSILFKLAIFFLLYHGNFHQIGTPDSPIYLRLAVALWKHHSYQTAVSGDMLLRTPGYPFFEAAIFSLFGYKFVPVIIMQILLSAIPVVCAFLIGRRIFSLKVGLFAAAFVGFDYLMIGYSFLIISEMLYFCLLALCYTFAVYFFTQPLPTKKYAFLFGLLLAISTLVRPNSYFAILPVVVISLVFLVRKECPARVVFVSLALIALPTVFLVGGWQLRNKLVAGKFIYTRIFSKDVVINAYPKVVQAERESRSNVNVAAQSGVSFLLRHPLSTAEQILGSSWRIIFGTSRALPRLYYSGDWGDLAKKRIVFNDFAGFHFGKVLHDIEEEYLLPGMLVYIVSTVIINILLYLLVLYAVISLVRCRQLASRNAFAHVFLWGALFYFLGTASNAVANGRFRVPCQLPIDLYAAAGLVYVMKRISSKGKASAQQVSPTATD